MLILAIDLGQSKSAFCEFDTQDNSHAMGTIQDLDRQLPRLLTELQPDLVVIEICPLAGRVHDLVTGQGVKLIVADTTQDPWQWKNVKRKTDRDDALKLAHLAALGQINAVYMPSPRMRAWRQLLALRRSLVTERTRIKNRIRALLVVVDQKLPAGKSGWTQERQTELWSWARPLESCGPDEMWRGMLEIELQRLDAIGESLRQVESKLDRLASGDERVKLLKSIPGVGVRTAEVLVTALDRADRFQTRRQVSAYAGLVPRRYQSGQIDRQGRISKRGASHVRQALNQAAWVAISCDDQMSAFYLRLTDGGRRRRKQAIVAVMRKLFVLAWAILRDGRPYESRRQVVRTAA
jgi:transposase